MSSCSWTCTTCAATRSGWTCRCCPPVSRLGCGFADPWAPRATCGRSDRRDGSGRGNFVRNRRGEPMSIRQYVRALRRRAWIPILLVAVAMLGTGTLLLTCRPQYIATATVIANSPSTGANRTLNFSEVVGSNTLLLGVIDALDLPDDPASLAQRISVTNDRGSNLYRITVTDPDPKRATATANAVAESATRLYTQLGSDS